jgi:NADH dehydrogenase (ubiquinone) 1 alpha/beta subcomplex 1
MFRPTLLLNAASKATLYRSAPAFSRFYSAGALSQADIESRVLEILKGFDKVDQSKVRKR